MIYEWLDPVILSLGPLQVRWYGALYVLSFLVGGLILRSLAQKRFWPLPVESIDKFIPMMIVAMFVGARLGYVVIYNWHFYASNFSHIFYVWKGGLSFYGALVAMLFSSWIFARRNNVSYYRITDALALAATPGLFLGRLGNFINGELYGRVTDSWIGVIFPGGGPLPRHPSQIYEGVFEGILLFIVLWYVHRKQRFFGVTSSAFLMGYGLLRFFIEFFREPDPQLGYLLGYFTIGQLLAIGMIMAGYSLIKRAHKAHQHQKEKVI